MSKKTIAAIALVTVTILLVIDVSRAPSSQWTTKASVAAIHLYRSTLAPLLVREGFACRFTPTCSRYAEAVLMREGFLRGGWKAAGRIARCGPWTPKGTVDPW